MSKLEIIRNILHDNFKHPNQSQLSEIDYDHRGKRFEVTYKIVKQPQIEIELYRYDETAFPFFKNIPNLKKMCDFILFAQEGNYLYIFVIELKLGNISAKKQLDAASEFVNYIINSANRIGKNIDTNYRVKKIRICDEMIKKRKTSVNKTIFFDENDYCEYPYQNLFLEPLMRY